MMCKLHRRRILWGLSVAIWLLAGSVSCAKLPGSAEHLTEGAFRPGQIYEVKQQRLLTFEDLLSSLQTAEVIYFGEAHYTPPHVEAALRVLTRLQEEGRAITVAMEMFSWDGQDGLDRYVRREITDQAVFLEESRWKKNWGTMYEVYQPLVEFARDHRLPLRALNPPLSLVRRVSKSGLARIASDPEVRRWSMDEPFPIEDPEYYRVLYEQIEECHPGLSKEVYQKIYEASIFRDEGMSKIIAEALTASGSSDPVVVSYTGAGHIQYGQPVPKRVVRRRGRSLQQVTVYLHPYDPQRPGDVQGLLDEGIADYLWLTSLGPNGPQSRCGE